MKRIITFLIIIIFILLFVGCYGGPANEAEPENTEAIIRCPDGTIINGIVQEKLTGSGGGFISVKIDNIWYVTSYVNVILIQRGDE